MRFCYHTLCVPYIDHAYTATPTDIFTASDCSNNARQVRWLCRPYLVRRRRVWLVLWPHRGQSRVIKVNRCPGDQGGQTNTSWSMPSVHAPMTKSAPIVWCIHRHRAVAFARHFTSQTATLPKYSHQNSFTAISRCYSPLWLLVRFCLRHTHTHTLTQLRF